MQTDDIRTPSEEPIVSTARSDDAPFRDGQDAPEKVDDNVGEERARAQQVALPIWLSEKFHWHTSESGYTRLRPNPEFLAAVEADAPKFELYGYKLVHPEGTSSTEADLAETLKFELAGLMQTMQALHDREASDLQRWMIDRCTRNCVYAAITQFEVDQWSARAAASGKDASEHENFGEKKSRRDSFAVAGAVFGEVVRHVLPEVILGDQAFVKTARSVIYQQADMRGRELLNPQQQDAQNNAAIAAAVATSRPF